MTNNFTRPLHSRRQWDGLIKNWKINIHKYDPEGQSNKAEDNTEKEEKKSSSRSSEKQPVSWADEVDEEEELNRSLSSAMSLDDVAPEDLKPPPKEGEVVVVDEPKSLGNGTCANLTAAVIKVSLAIAFSAIIALCVSGVIFNFLII